MIQLLISIPFIGFILGIVFFLIFFLPINTITWFWRFNTISKIAREEHLDKEQWSYSTRLFQIMYFPDQIIAPTDSARMLQAKQQLINHVKKGWKIAIWWMVIEALFFLGAALILYLAHLQK